MNEHSLHLKASLKWRPYMAAKLASAALILLLFGEVTIAFDREQTQ